jgi:hypothetical protein
VFARGSVALAALAFLAFGSASASGGWKHVNIERRKGVIEATLSYDTLMVGGGFRAYRRIALVVRRAGTIVIDDRRYPVPVGGQVRGLMLRSVWGNSDPEVLVEIWTGGDSCCDQLGVGLIDRTGTGRVLVHDFGMGWSEQWHDGTLDFVSSDFRFYCAFTTCASASQPIQILAIDRAGRHFVDATRSRPGLIAADAGEQWKEYLHERAKHAFYDPVGVLAPWCADQYLLRRKKDCDQVLAHALARGVLSGRHTGDEGTAQGGRAVINLLHKTLAAWGYDRR